jgi:predicted phosphodiesterase
MNQAFRRILCSPAVRGSHLVVVTGDVTDQGSERAWRRFRTALADAELDHKTLVVLGNHDVCGLGARLGTPTQLKRDDLRRARGGLILCGQPSKYPWARQVEQRIVIFGLNSNNSGNLTPVTNALGRLGYHQLAALAGLLHRHQHVPIKIVALHHSPNIPARRTALRRGDQPVGMVTRWLHQMPQEDRRALRLLCLAHRVRLVLHGHLHAAEDRLVNGIRIIGAPAATELSCSCEIPISHANTRERTSLWPKCEKKFSHQRRRKEHRFYQYLVNLRTGRVERRLLTVPA